MKKILTSFIALLLLVSCDDYLEIQPVGQVIPTTVEDYRGFLTSAYSITTASKVLSAYRGDEVQLYPDAPGVEQYEDIFIWNDINQSPLTQSFPYVSLYHIIFYANHIINSQEEIQGDKTAIDQLVGEAHALRSLQYFELVNLYAAPYNPSSADTDLGVPITTAYDAERDYQRSTVEEVYAQIQSDLQEAEALIVTQRQDAGLNYRFSTWAVKAFKARVALYKGEWELAVSAANEALAIGSDLQDLNASTDQMPSEYNSVESILALEPVVTFDLVNNATISDELLGAYDKLNDLRFDLNFHQNSSGRFRSNNNSDNKFKVSFRTSELYLNLAEAYAQLEQLDLAREALFELAQNRYTPDGFAAYKSKISELSSAELVKSILEERQRELAIEGHRWYDLRRTTQPQIKKVYNGQRYTLEQGDERYVIPFPNDARINNPDL